MKIAIIRKKYVFHGGAEGILRDIIAKLSDAGHEVHIFAIQWEGTTPSRNIYFHKVPTLTFNSFVRDLTFALSSYVMLRARRKDFDIIQSHDKTLYQDIYFITDGCHIEWLKQRLKRRGPAGKASIILNPYHWLILAIERMIFKGHRYKKIVAISEFIKRNVVDNYYVNSEDVLVMYQNVDLERFHPRNVNLYREDMRRLYSIGDDDFVILFVGSGFERKGVEYLIKAVEKVQDPVTVLIVGRGSGDRYRNIIKRQHVIFSGPQEDVHKYFAASDVLVMPVLYEPFGIVYLEALASGIPVITTRHSGASEIIEEGKQGFIVNEPEDIDYIAERITSLIGSDRKDLMAGESRALAETLSRKENTDRLLGLYEEIRQN